MREVGYRQQHDEVRELLLLLADCDTWLPVYGDDNDIQSMSV